MEKSFPLTARKQVPEQKGTRGGRDLGQVTWPTWRTVLRHRVEKRKVWAGGVDGGSQAVETHSERPAGIQTVHLNDLGVAGFLNVSLLRDYFVSWCFSAHCP